MVQNGSLSTWWFTLYAEFVASTAYILLQSASSPNVHKVCICKCVCHAKERQTHFAHCTNSWFLVPKLLIRSSVVMPLLENCPSTLSALCVLSHYGRSERTVYLGSITTLVATGSSLWCTGLTVPVRPFLKIHMLPAPNTYRLCAMSGGGDERVKQKSQSRGGIQ